MSKNDFNFICEICKHYLQPFPEKGFDDAVCGSPAVQAIDDPEHKSHFAPMIDDARDICDREGDGRFVYYEPKTPTAGAAAFVQITRERPQTLTAGGLT